MTIPFLVVIQRVEKPEESPGKGLSPGKAPLFVPHARGSLDFARDDVLFFTEKGTREDVVFLVVISTKRSAWRNPPRRSSNTTVRTTS